MSRGTPQKPHQLYLEDEREVLARRRERQRRRERAAVAVHGDRLRVGVPDAMSALCNSKTADDERN